MSENVLTVAVRETTGKGVARKLRAAGRIPGVLYGRAKDPVALSLDPQGLERAIQRSEAGVNTLFDLNVEEGSLGKRVVLVKELQREPVDGSLLHADLLEVDLQQTVEVEVPIHLEGIPVGVSMEGGIMDHALRELKVECLPRSIPDEVVVDVAELNIGDSLHVRDLVLPEGVTLREDPDVSVLSVVQPQKEEEPTISEVEGEEGEPLAEGETPAEGAAAEGEEKAPEGDSGKD